jgi:hypothetical protein
MSFLEADDVHWAGPVRICRKGCRGYGVPEKISSDVHIYVAVRRVDWQVRQVWHMRKHEGSLKKA